MPRKITWDDILAQEKNFIGRDIQCEESGRLTRGPIAGIARDGHLIRFYCDWHAARNMSDPKWVHWLPHHDPQFAIDESTNVYEEDNGTIMCSTMHTGEFRIFPMAVDKLDPRDVEGLIP